MIRVSYEEVQATLAGVLRKLGFDGERAELCARFFADTSRDGVYSHGLNRFPRFVRTIQHGIVDVGATPQLTAKRGALERWDGRSGPGNLNAWHAMERAIALCREHGVGCVALANTNHWMRGGTYGWQAADEGVIGICWTNTMPNLPPWGASVAVVGNNPLVIAVPRPPAHVVLDMAMSQFSYGALQSYRTRREPLPVAGGFDNEGKLTQDAAAIEASRRPLPTGYWKGSGLALLLDLVAGMLSGGRFTREITPDPERETGLSQVFLAFDPAFAGAHGITAEKVEQVMEEFLEKPRARGERVRYPGQRQLETRQENLANGIPVEPSVWDKIRAM